MMHLFVLIIFSLLLLSLESTTANQLVAIDGGRGDDNGGIHKCIDKERQALLHFKAHLQDPKGWLSTWRADEHDCCEWYGVICNNQTGHVIRLDIQYGGLVGKVSDSLLNLSYLTLLDLSSNSFHGTIPSYIGSLSKLRYLGLSGNSFHGTIPRSIGSLAQLWYLDLSSNSFHGTIPSSIGSLTKLRYLYLSDNSFHGTIPPEFGNLTNMQELNLASARRCRVENVEWLSHLSRLEDLEMDGISLAKANHWVDVILSLPKLSYLSLEGCELSLVMHPYSFFANSSSSIEFLYLGYNNLTSSMYGWLFPLTSNKLRSLHLSSNMLDGIPKYLGNLCRLETFYFYNNSVIVTFPDFLNNLTGCTSLSLKSLSTSGSRFTGNLSKEFLNFKSLVELDLSKNQMIGNINEKLLELPSLSNVEAIDLSSCKLGPRFPIWIKSLQNVTSLNIANTGISDTIPLEFWNMWPSQLRYLNLSSNNIKGKVPDLSSNFDKDSMIDLSFNKFCGLIPNVSSTLASLNLSNNKFYGGISFLCEMVDGFLKFLDLSNNFLSGQLPDCLWHFKELKVLNLGNNNLSGKLPTSISSLIKLEALYLYKNNFSGQLPWSLKNCTSLNLLNLGDNKFSGNVPLWIGENLFGLYVLFLRSNKFFGTIPLQLCQLANLQILDLSQNNLNGTIPSCLNNLTRMVQEGFFPMQNIHFFLVPSMGAFEYIDYTMVVWQGAEREILRNNLVLLKSIDLSSNHLTGQIPHELTDLYELILLNLSKNALIGEIPQKICRMKNLLTLDLSRNGLSGGIPSSMSQMTLLNDLNLSFNNLSGRIPSSTQLQSFEPSRYNGNLGLCGPPLTKNCSGDEESKRPPVGESDIDELQGWFYIGGVTGFATGFSIVCGTLLFNHRGRHVFSMFLDSFTNWIYVKMALFIANL